MFPRLCLRIVSSEASTGFGHHGPFRRLIAESPPSCHDRKLPSMVYVHVTTIACNAQSRLSQGCIDRGFSPNFLPSILLPDGW
jgi:hypothetical protein